MSDKLSISGDDDDWQVFGKTPPNGNEVLFRSRAANPAVHDFAVENQMARVRCVLAPDEVADNGMPKSTKDVDDFEDSLLGALHTANAEVYLIAVVTGEGNRDLFFAARDLDDLRQAIKASTSADTIKLQFAPVGEKEAFLKGLSLSPEQTRAAIEEGRVHRVPSPSAGRFFTKLFGR